MQVRVIVITPLIPVYFRHVITPFLDVSSGNEQLVQLKNWVVARKGLVDSHFENQHFFLGGGGGVLYVNVSREVIPRGWKSFARR